MDLTARQAILATVAVLAIAVAAATLPDPVTDGGGAPTPVTEDGAAGDGGFFGTDGEGISLGFGGNMEFRAICIPFLLSPWFLVGAVLALVLLAYLINRRTDPIATIGFFGLFLPPAILIFLLLTDCRPPQPDVEEASPIPEYNISFLFQNPGGSDPTGGGSIPATSPSFVVLLGVLAVVVLFVFLRTTGDDEFEEEVEEEPIPEPDVALADVGATAGRAADRIEGQATLENEVFRAWREMTDLLDLPDPETTTPREFADRATAAGMNRDHVEALTTLFEETRYGGIEPDAERERQALAILRRIESTYAEPAETGEGSEIPGEDARPDSREGEDARWGSTEEDDSRPDSREGADTRPDSTEGDDADS